MSAVLRFQVDTKASMMMMMIHSTLGPVTTWMGDCLRAVKRQLENCVFFIPLSYNQPSRSTQPSTLRGTVK